MSQYFGLSHSCLASYRNGEQR